MIASEETAPEPIANRPYSGKFMVRIPPDVHRKLAVQAAESGMRLNACSLQAIFPIILQLSRPRKTNDVRKIIVTGQILPR